MNLVRHVVRTYQRYQADAGDRLAGAVTYYWFLSLFPILLLAIYVLRLVNGDSAASDVQGALSGYLPGDLVSTIGETVGSKAGTAGLLGVAGLLFAGLGWIDALRQAIRVIWHETPPAGNIVTRKIADIVALLGLLATVGGSVFVTSLVGSGPGTALDFLGVDRGSQVAKLFLQISAIALAGLADVALFLYLFLRLGRVGRPLRASVQGAVFGAVGFAVLKLVGGFYVARTTSKGQATYGTFAVVVGLLLFLNLLSRLILYAAAFAVTTVDADGVPLVPKAPAQSKIVDVERSWSTKPVPEEPVPPVVSAVAPPPAELPHAGTVAAAARVLGALAGLAIVGVLVHAVRTVSRLRRSSGV